MPGVGIGVYPGYNPGLHEGEEVSSTYEGRHITVLEQNLIHPNHLAVGLNLVQKGDPVIICNTVALGGPGNYGNAVGVALATATAITDLIAVDTEGIWLLPAFSYTDGAAGSAIVAGDPLFIHDESLAAVGALGLGDAMISKISNIVTQVPFGYALGTMVAAGSGTIAIKVHWDPRHLAEIFGAITFNDPVTMDQTLFVTGAVTFLTTLYTVGVVTCGTTLICIGATFIGAGVTVTGLGAFNSGISVAGTTELQTVLIHSSIAVAAGGLLTFPQVTNATQLPAAAGALPSGSLWCNANVVTRVP